jgi:transcriptional regulator
MPRMMRMILPFRLSVSAVDGTWKLNQNKTDAVRSAAAGHLARQDDPGAQAIARLMQGLDKG